MLACLRTFLSLLLVLACGCSSAVEEASASFESGREVLAGTIFSPGSPGSSGRSPGVVLVHETGSEGRENTDYRRIADEFARRGFAVLVYDKRGCGASSGDWRESSFDVLVDDALAAVDALRGTAGVDGERVGLWGGGEGGVVAALAAARDPRITFVILQSAPGVSFAEQDLYETGRELDALRVSHGEREIGLELVRRKHVYARTGEGWSEYADAARLAAGSPWAYLASPDRREDWWWLWFRSTMDVSPVEALEQLRVPVLAIWGAEDPLVPVATSHDAVAAALKRSPAKESRCAVLSGADHTLHSHGWYHLWARGFADAPVQLDLMGDWAESAVGRSEDSTGGAHDSSFAAEGPKRRGSR